MRFLAIFTLLVVPAYSVAATLEQQIDKLISSIDQSQCRFIRNDNFYSPQQSMKHLRRKYVHFKNKITSVDDFIQIVATKSLMSGKTYKVQCSDKTPVPAALWMRQQTLNLDI